MAHLRQFYDKIVTVAVFIMEKLAVIPGCRHKGYGRRLMDFAADYIGAKGGNKISIGVINENQVLKKWYIDYGFKEIGIKKFSHLPFEVCFMEKEIPVE